MNAARSLRVLVSVGTDHHPFDRLIEWLDAWLEEVAPIEVECLIQHGATRSSMQARNVEYLSHDDLQEAMDRADIVVTHGGPASLVEAGRHGHVPVCVPRDPLRGEHIDGHQMAFAPLMAKRGRARLCLTRDEFMATMHALATQPPKRSPRAVTAPPAGLARLEEVVNEVVEDRRSRSGGSLLQLRPLRRLWRA